MIIRVVMAIVMMMIKRVKTVFLSRLIYPGHLLFLGLPIAMFGLLFDPSPLLCYFYGSYWDDALQFASLIFRIPFPG